MSVQRISGSSEPQADSPASELDQLRELAPLLVVLAVLFLVSVLWPILAAAAVLLAAGRSTTRWRLRLHIVVFVGAVCALLTLHGFAGYIAHAPAWHAWRDLHANFWQWLGATAPFSLLVGAWLALGTELWLSTPVNRRPTPTRRGFALALTIYPVWAGASALLNRLGRRQRGQKFRLGRSRLRPVVLAERDLLEHTVVFGATGSGKTNTLRLIAGQAIAAGWPVIVLDLKGDAELANELERTAAAARADFALVTIRDDPRRANWNPIATGSANARADRLIVGEWSEEHYERTARDFARSALTLLALIGETATIPTLVRYLEQPDLLMGAVADALNAKSPAPEVGTSLKQERERFAALLAARTKDRSILSATAGLAARLRELSESDLRPALTGEAATSTINLARTLATDAGVVCFSLDSASDPSVATLAGSLALRDLQHAISARPPGVTPALVLLDEFSVLESDEIKGLLARARAKRVGVVLSTQSLADLTAVDLNLKTQTLSNTATKIIHRLGGDEEPELIASLAGTRTVEEFTHQTLRRIGITGPRHTPTGTGSARQVEEYNLHPNRLRDLKRGHAAVILRAEPQWKGYVRIDDAEKRLKEIEGRSLP